MSILTALEAFKSHIAKSVHFASPSAYMEEKEAEFKQAVADEHESLAKRIDELEAKVEALLAHPAVSVPAIESPATTTMAQVTEG